MNPKYLLKLLLPPIIVKGLSFLLNRFKTSQDLTKLTDSHLEWEYLPEGWQAHNSKVKGWNVESVAQAQKEKWSDFLVALAGTSPLSVAHEAATVVASAEDYISHNILVTYAYALTLASRFKDQMSLLDWGGGIGHYYVLSKAILHTTEIEYHCKDVPVLCRTGESVLPNVSFHDNEESCFQRSYDFILVSGSLQFSENWREILQRLITATRGYLYITRFPILENHSSYVVIQRPYQYGYDTEYIHWHINRSEFMDVMHQSSLKLVREFLSQPSPFVTNAPEQAQYRGFLFHRE